MNFSKGYGTLRLVNIPTSKACLYNFFLFTSLIHFFLSHFYFILLDSLYNFIRLYVKIRIKMLSVLLNDFFFLELLSKLIK